MAQPNSKTSATVNSARSGEPQSSLRHSIALPAAAPIIASP
jgi:hypothetical protein